MRLFSSRLTSLPKRILICSVVALIYFLSGKIGLRLAFVNASATAVWPPTGIAFASFLLFGDWIWPAIFLGAFLTNVTTAGTIISSLGIAAGNTLEGIIGAYLVKTFANGKYAFESPQSIFRFTFLAGLAATTVSATIGVTTLILTGFANPLQYFSVWLTWWLGDAAGAIIITPFLLSWTFPSEEELSKKMLGEVFFLFAITAVCGVIVFGNIFPVIGKAYPLEFLCIPPLMWVAVRFGKRETTTATIIISLIAIWGTLHGYGPFALASQNESLLLLQSFMSITMLTAVILAALVSERKRIHQQQQSNEKRFQALIEKSFDAIVLIDKFSKILYASPSVKRVLGYPPEELIGMTGFDLVISEDRHRTMRELAGLVLKPGGTVTVQYRALKKDKDVIWVEAVGTNLLFEPYIHAVVVNFRDITQLKISKENLAQEKAEDEALLESIGDGIIATDKDENIILVNKAFEDLLGWQKKEVFGKMASDLLIMQDDQERPIPASSQPLHKTLITKKKVSTTTYLQTKGKEKFFSSITAAPVMVNEKTVAAIMVFHDITKEKEIDRAKSEFVSLASHQLRTPLSIIKWYLELFLESSTGPLNTKQRRYIHQISESNKRMIALIESLLNISRLDLGTVSVNPESTDVVKLLDQTLTELNPLLVTKHLRLKKEFSKSLPKVNLDSKLTTMIFQNLLTNAIKYTPEKGVITLSIKEDQQKQLTFIISDTGLGIPQKQQGQIFTKLFRADNIRTIDQNGNGLGLYIVKSILDQTGGNIRFESAENKGTTFYVSYPLSGMHTKAGIKSLQ